MELRNFNGGADRPEANGHSTGRVLVVGPYKRASRGVAQAEGSRDPALANAIDDAVGVRLTDMPLTAEKVLRLKPQNLVMGLPLRHMEMAN